MIEVALYEPEIPPNTGNIIRLCANTGAKLHLIHPIGFNWDDKQLRRAGLDYHEWAHIQHHDNFQNFLEATHQQRLLAFSTKGTNFYHQINYQSHDVLLFGPETRGLPQAVLAQVEMKCVLKIPMQSYSRSLNLSNAAAVVVYEAWRQLNFK